MSNEKECRIFRFFDGAHMTQTVPPYGFDYVKGLQVRLAPILKFQRGRVTSKNFYESTSLDAQGNEVPDEDTLVVSETFEYTEDSQGFARQRVQTIRWYANDGSVSGTKRRVKLYDNRSSREEGRRRRRNVVDNLSMAVLGLVAATETQGDMTQARAIAVPWLAAVDDVVARYIEKGGKELSDTIEADQDATWLDNPISADATIRSFCVSELK